MRKSEARKKAYVTKKQLQFLAVVTPFRCWIGGRGSGKSTAIAYSIMKKVVAMPGSAGMLTCITIDQLKENTLSSIQKMWKRHNIHKYDVRDNPMGKYVLFREPPPSWIRRSIQPPAGFTNVIYFRNGTWIKVISLKQYNSARGGSYDWAEIDEAAFYPEKFYSEILDASIRGNKGRWTSPFHHQVSFYSSMPYLAKGKWVLKFEELSRMHPDEFYYQESTVYDNLRIFGKAKLERSKKLLSWFKFQVEYMNLRVNRSDKGYYHAYSDEKHVYGPIDREYANATIQDFYYNPSKELTASFDFGGHYSPMGIFQEYQNTEYQLNHFDAKKRESLRDLCYEFADTYATHKLKVIHVYGDPHGHDAGVHGKSAYQFVTQYLTDRGWRVVICVQNKAADSHQTRHLNMNTMLEETDPQLPRLKMHRHRCKDAIIAMQLTEAKDDFQKDKKTERDKDFPQEHAAHNTDIIDYLFTQKHGWKFGRDDFYLPHRAYIS